MNAPLAVQTGILGDFLLVFDDLSAALAPSRTGQVWTLAARCPNSRLWFNAPGPAWKGSPFTFAEAGATRVWLLGELYGRTTDQVAATMMAVATGEKPASLLNGHFLLLAYDGKSATWNMWTDRFGTFHGYYGAGNGRLAAGSYFPSVTAISSRRQFDHLGLLGFFSFDFFPGDRTFFDDVRILRPASIYQLRGAATPVTRERYWDWEFRPAHGRSQESFVEAFAERFGQVLAEHSQGGRVALPLSGGLDSRATLTALLPIAAERRLWPYSYGYGRDSVEIRIGAQLAAAAGMTHCGFPIQPYLFDRFATVLASVEGFQDLTLCRQAAIGEPLARHADSVIAAHWGDVWFDSAMPQSPFPAGLTGAKPDRETLAALVLHKFVKQGSAWFSRHLRLPVLGSEPSERLLMDWIAVELPAYDGIEDLDFKLKAIKTDFWSARWTTASLRMFAAAAFPRLPFYDTRITDLFAEIPTAMNRSRSLQIEYIKTYSPRLAEVEWQARRANLYDYGRSSGRHLLRRAIAFAQRHWAGNPIERNWEIQLGVTERDRLAHWLTRPGLRLHEMVEPRATRDLLESFYRDPLTDKRGRTVSLLLSFSMWLEVYG